MSELDNELSLLLLLGQLERERGVVLIDPDDYPTAPPLDASSDAASETHE